MWQLFWDIHKKKIWTINMRRGSTNLFLTFITFSFYSNILFSWENSEFGPKIGFTITIESKISQFPILVMCEVCDCATPQNRCHVSCPIVYFQVFTNHLLGPQVFCFIRTSVLPTAVLLTWSVLPDPTKSLLDFLGKEQMKKKYYILSNYILIISLVSRAITISKFRSGKHPKTHT